MTARQRGQPLVFLALIVVLWIGARVFAWTGGTPRAPVVAAAQAPPPKLRPSRQAVERPASEPGGLASLEPPNAMTFQQRALLRPHGLAIAPAAKTTLLGLVEVRATASPPMIDEMVRLEAPPSAAMLAQPSAITASATLSLPPRAGQHRWSGDAWALVRSGGGSISAGPGAATYGGNQVGGILRYRLAPGDPHRPTAYLRATAALNGSGEREAALGLSVRPAVAIPIFVAVEGRIGVFSGRTVIRPAVMAVTEFAPARLPGQTRAEFYAQAGYVGGTGATAFADGQLRIDRRIVQAGPVELRTGAGAWGGVQRGAARLDVGPAATLGISSGAASARIGLDWRFRVAGGAEPASGPSLTVSAGF